MSKIDLNVSPSQSTGTPRLEGHRKVVESTFDFDDWSITVFKSHILPSNCYCDSLDEDNTKGLCLETGRQLEELKRRRTSENDATESGNGDGRRDGFKCQVCRYSQELHLKHLPEMVFPDNILHLVYKPTGFVLQYNALDAMKLMSTKEANSYHVAVAEAWQTSKAELGLPKDVMHNFNWTFTTDYKGSMKQKKEDGFYTDALDDLAVSIQQNTEDKLNIQKLMEKEKILFYEEITLFEDELHDNGISNCSVKIRIMPSGMFILLRCFLRVDHVMAKFCDTRIHFEKGNKYFLRQYQVRQELFKNLGNPDPHTLSDINVLYNHLPVRSEVTDKVWLARNQAPKLG